MKRSVHSGFLILASCVVLAISSCSKDQTPGGGGADLAVNYPTSVSFYTGNNSAYPTVWKYTYNDKNLLIRYGADRVQDGMVRDISSYGVSESNPGTVFFSTTSYIFRMANAPDNSVNIYESAPTEVSIDDFYKYVISGTTTSNHRANWFLISSPDGLLQREIITNSRNSVYSYDDKKNLKQIDFVDLAGVNYGRIRVVSLDDNPSPFVAVKGYKYASYPQSSAKDYALSFCRNNPIQIVDENPDPATGQWKVNTKTDFKYQYNADGYPTQVIVTTTYYTNTVSTFTSVFNYTYRK